MPDRDRAARPCIRGVRRPGGLTIGTSHARTYFLSCVPAVDGSWPGWVVVRERQQAGGEQVRGTGRPYSAQPYVLEPVPTQLRRMHMGSGHGPVAPPGCGRRDLRRHAPDKQRSASRHLTRSPLGRSRRGAQQNPAWPGRQQPYVTWYCNEGAEPIHVRIAPRLARRVPGMDRGGQRKGVETQSPPPTFGVSFFIPLLLR